MTLQFKKFEGINQFGENFNVSELQDMCYYISRLMIEASLCGVPTVEINPSDTEVTCYVFYKFPYGAVQVLGDIWKQSEKLS